MGEDDEMFFGHGLRDIQDLIAKGVIRKTDEGGRSTGYELFV